MLFQKDLNTFQFRVTAVPNKALLTAVVFAIALFAGQRAAHSEFTVCNQTLDVFNVAIAYDIEDEFQTEGWWTIAANRCVDVIRTELQTRYVYVYATDVFKQPVLEGTVSMCIGEKKFTIRGHEKCWVRGHMAAHFLEVDTEKVERWTLFVKDAQR